MQLREQLVVVVVDLRALDRLEGLERADGRQRTGQNREGPQDSDADTGAAQEREEAQDVAPRTAPQRGQSCAAPRPGWLPSAMRRALYRGLSPEPLQTLRLNP